MSGSSGNTIGPSHRRKPAGAELVSQTFVSGELPISKLLSIDIAQPGESVRGPCRLGDFDCKDRSGNAARNKN
jgi:hypothetical protein